MTLAFERADKIGGENLAAASRDILARCDALARFTEVAGKTQRTFLCDAMHPVHALIRQWMRDAGMTVRVDAAGNIIGHRPGKKFSSKTLILGSHLDTVRDAGKYDGILGVLAGIAAVKLLGDVPLEIGIDVVGFSEQEGERYKRPHLGSMAMCGKLDRDALKLKDRDGITLEDAIREFGLHPEEIEFAARKPQELAGYLELHLEQGPVLEGRCASVGVVVAVTGQTRVQLRLVGKGGHAGTLPMKARKDALAGAADAILVVETCAQEIDGLVATVGHIECIPNGSSTVPEEVRFTVDVRHEDDTSRENSVECMLTTIQQISRDRGLGMELLSRTDTAAVQMDMELTARLIDSVRATRSTGGVQKMISGAMHDAAMMASITPAAMLLVRSPGGVGHGPEESVSAEDVGEAVKVLYEFLRGYSAALLPGS